MWETHWSVGSFKLIWQKFNYQKRHASFILNFFYQIYFENYLPNNPNMQPFQIYVIIFWVEIKLLVIFVDLQCYPKKSVLCLHLDDRQWISIPKEIESNRWIQATDYKKDKRLSGYLLDTNWELLEKKPRPKFNNVLSIFKL